MRHPSIRWRLVLGTVALVALTLLIGGMTLYRSFKKTLYKEIDVQLLQTVSLLAKSSELQIGKVEYEWQEAMKSPEAPEISGVFAFLNLSTGEVTKSPELGARDLPFEYGKPYRPVVKSAVLADGRQIRFAGLLHYPSIDQEALDKAKNLGMVLVPENHPQVVVAARETDFLTKRLAHFKGELAEVGIAAIIVIACAIIGISTWCLRPIVQFTNNLLARSSMEEKAASAVPNQLPSELITLAKTFNATLEKVEAAREREKEFAFHAAHELRTPVAGIYVTLEQAIARDRSSDDMRDRISETMGMLNQMRLTLESLMKLARLKGKLERPSREVIFIDEFLDEVIVPVTDEITSKGISISIDIQEAAGTFFGDKGLLRIVVSNLIRNAVRYCPPTTDVVVNVSSGPGIFTFTCKNIVPNQVDISSMEKWFEPFHRAAGNPDEVGHHAGLGLSLAREAAMLMEGKLISDFLSPNTVQFIFRLPVIDRNS